MKKLIFLFLFLACSQGFAQEVSSTNLVALLANPTFFNDKAIVVSGYVCRAETAQHGLFLTRTDCEDANYANAVALNLDAVRKIVPKGPSILTVEGRFEDRSNLIFTDESFRVGLIKASNISGRSLR